MLLGVVLVFECARKYHLICYLRQGKFDPYLIINLSNAAVISACYKHSSSKLIIKVVKIAPECIQPSRRKLLDTDL